MTAVIHGVNAGDTVDLLKERAVKASQGKDFDDGRKLALIVEGGAMRGVISCGALQALEEIGMTSVFDEVYGASAGAVNAAYFLAGQAAYATTIYYQKVNDGRFIRSMWRSPVVDLDELFSSVVGRERPLSMGRVMASPSQLYIVIADAVSGECFLSLAQSSATPLLTLLKASSALPLLYNGRVAVDGRECFDGGLVNPIPILDAIENGCTDLLVLLTRPESFRDCAPAGLESRLFELRCARGNAAILNAFNNNHVRSNALRDIAFGRHTAPPGINIATICPREDDPRVERTTRNAVILKNAAIANIRNTLEAFGYPVEEVVEVLRPFPIIPRESPVPGVDSESGDSTLTAA